MLSGLFGRFSIIWMVACSDAGTEETEQTAEESPDAEEDEGDEEASGGSGGSVCAGGKVAGIVGDVTHEKAAEIDDEADDGSSVEAEATLNRHLADDVANGEGYGDADEQVEA